MDEARYWCHMCSQMVDPIMEVETIKCPFCQSGFVEEIESATADHHHPPDFDGGSDSDRALSLWAPILLGMMSNPRRRRRSRRLEFDIEDDNEGRDSIHDDNNNNSNNNGDHQRDSELDRELDAIIRRRRRSSATILQLLQGIRAGMLSAESENQERETREQDNNNSSTRDREHERVILINPFNQTIIVQGSYDLNNNNPIGNNPQNPIGSLGDYFIGPGLDLLLQHLAENDPNRYGTPPAQKEAVEAMPTVKIEQSLQCSVCLEDFDVGAEAKEMPCKHRFHDGCILPWLELHSSCPVCRYQLPSDESKLGSEMSRNGSSNNGSGGGEEVDDDDRNGNGRRFAVPLPWPFSTLFAPPGTQLTNRANANVIANSSSSSPSSSSNAPESAPSGTDEN